MEIRTLRAPEREHWLALLQGWSLPDGWRGRDFFRRWIDADPTYQDENVWVAVEDGELLSCVQIFPRLLRVLGQPVPAGGIGSVYTRPDRRRAGLAGALLERGVRAMGERRMELSLLFANQLDFYEKHGWISWRSQRTFVRRSRHVARAPASGSGVDAEVASFDPLADLAAVQSVHAAYSQSRNGTVVRDDALWDASLRLAGNPDEEFQVARHGGEIVAYLRVAALYGQLVVIELGRRENGAAALAALVEGQLAPEQQGDAGQAERRALAQSADLRAQLMLPAFDDLQLTLALEGLGIVSQPVDDPSNMVRVLNAPALSRRLGVGIHPGETPSDFLRRILPPDSFVFWSADRF